MSTSLHAIRIRPCALRLTLLRNTAYDRAAVNPEVFYLHINGEQRGPYTVPQIDHLLNSGLIEEDTLFWREGLEQWQPITNLVAKRKPARKWIKPAIAGGILLLLLLVARLLGPTIREGWLETAQYEFSEKAAYWRARDVVRTKARASGAVVEFFGFSRAKVQLQPPDHAAVTLRGNVAPAGQKSHPAAWQVDLEYQPGTREWSGLAVQELPADQP